MAHKVKRRHIKAKHQKKRYFRANDPLLSVFMWGVNQTVSAVPMEGSCNARDWDDTA